MFLEKELFGMSAPAKTEQAPLLEREMTDRLVALREKIDAIALRSLEERFSPADLERILSPSDTDVQTWRTRFAQDENHEADETDLEVYRKEFAERKRRLLERRFVEGRDPFPGEIVTETGQVIAPGAVSDFELIDLLKDMPIFPVEQVETALSSETFEQPFICGNAECEMFSERVEAIYAGYDGKHLSGDYYRVWRCEDGNGQNVVDIALIDAEGHGGRALPLAMLTASLLQSVDGRDEREAIESLDAQLASMRIERKEVSLQKATLKYGPNASSKELSLVRAGQCYAFWVDGDREAGYVVKIITPEKLGKSVGLEPLMLETESETVNIGFGMVADVEKKDGLIHPQIFQLPKDAAVFFASDGIFDMFNPKKENTLKEHFSLLCDTVVGDAKSFALDREMVEKRLFDELRRVVGEYEQTDDITVVKVAF